MEVFRKGKLTANQKPQSQEDKDLNSLDFLTLGGLASDSPEKYPKYIASEFQETTEIHKQEGYWVKCGVKVI